MISHETSCWKDPYTLKLVSDNTSKLDILKQNIIN